MEVTLRKRREGSHNGLRRKRDEGVTRTEKWKYMVNVITKRQVVTVRSVVTERSVR